VRLVLSKQAFFASSPFDYRPCLDGHLTNVRRRLAHVFDCRELWFLGNYLYLMPDYNQGVRQPKCSQNLLAIDQTRAQVEVGATPEINSA
jgi:hypothetical protein